MKSQLRFYDAAYREISEHLFPGDGKEALAFALCGHGQSSDKVILTVHEVFLVPNDICERDELFVQWPTDFLLPILEKAKKENLHLLKIHSHPTGFNNFSETDDKSDKELRSRVDFFVSESTMVATAIILPDGKIIARQITSGGNFQNYDSVLLAGSTIKIWRTGKDEISHEEANYRNIQTFGEGTFKLLQNLKIAVIGCSGTGSPIIQALGRLGAGEILAIDPDKVELKNLNRIIGATLSDAQAETPKVEVMERMVTEMGTGTKLSPQNADIFEDLELLREIACCDIIFGCVDSVDARDLLNAISDFYLVPYFDLGVGIESDGKGGIGRIGSQVHYVFPGSPSLQERGLFSFKDLESAHHFRQDREGFADLVQDKNSYIEDIPVDRPAVIPVNMFTSGGGVIEFLARLHPFRTRSNDEFIGVRFLIGLPGLSTEKIDSQIPISAKSLGRGDVFPFLYMTMFGNEVVISEN